MRGRLAGRVTVLVALIMCLGCLPAFAGAAGSGSATSPPVTTTTSTATTTVNCGDLNVGTVYQGTISVSGAMNTVEQYAWGTFAGTAALLDELANSIGGISQTALTFYRNAVIALPSNYELLTATAPNAASFLYYNDGASASRFSYPSSITDGGNALGIELQTVGGRTAAWNQTVSGPSNYAYAVSAKSVSSTTQKSVIRAGDIVLATNLNTINQMTRFTGDADVTVYQVEAQKFVSPLVLDLRGNGQIEASDGNWLPHPGHLDRSRLVPFDFFGNGFDELMEWIGPDDGFLIVPRLDGRVDGNCLFGTTGGWASGFEKLAQRDTNHDGQLTGDELRGLYVWQDRNSNGRIDPGELRTVQEMHITQISLKQTMYRSSFVMDGQTRTMWDWWPSALEMRKISLSDLR